MAESISARGTRRVSYSRPRVWRALAVLEPYCAVCDVSYVVDGGPAAEGTRFSCVPGRLGDQPPPSGAPRGQVIEWQPSRRVTTRLELTPEVWTTTIELIDVPGGGTDVTITLTHQPTRGSRVRRALQRGGVRKVAQRTIESELSKIAGHVSQAERAAGSPRDG